MLSVLYCELLTSHLSISLMIALRALIDSINYSTIILMSALRKNNTIGMCLQKNMDPIEFVVVVPAYVCKTPAHLKKKPLRKEDYTGPYSRIALI